MGDSYSDVTPVRLFPRLRMQEVRGDSLRVRTGTVGLSLVLSHHRQLAAQSADPDRRLHED